LEFPDGKMKEMRVQLLSSVKKFSDLTERKFKIEVEAELKQYFLIG